MCGICGFVSREEISLDQLKEMNDEMYHRGPDDSGEEIYPLRDGYYAGLAQRRLSILDLSSLGHQPMHTDNGRVSLVYNGEIYNFRELREELSDYPFRSHCDTEVILAAYLKWGIDCLSRLNGMFALALLDREGEKLFLARDRIGKKPLYYWLQDQNLVFASELKSIRRTPGFHGRIRKEVLARYLYQQYINAPDSVFEDVYKLEPGGVLEFAGGRVRTWKYWEIRKAYEQGMADPVRDYDQARQELKDLLKQAVARRMISDVPLGAFLSGGYDSSLITAMAQEHSSVPVKTFSIGFHEEKYNEAKYAAQVADYLGTSHTELYIDEAQMFDLVESIPRYYDEPFADSSQIPSMLVAGLAKKDVTVVLSGDGGDEFYCGYNIYENVAQAQLLDLPGALVHGIFRLPGLQKLEERLPFRVRVIAGNRNPETKTQFGAGSYIRMAYQMAGGSEGQLPCHYEVERGYGERRWQIRRMLLDMDTYLPGDILCKVDRASMKYSLEARCPILDRDVMEYSFRIPHSYKYHKGDKKHILKEIAYDYIPRELLDRPKVGFGVPLDQWLRGPLKEQLLDYSEKGYLERQGIFDSSYVSEIIRNYIRTGDGGPATGANYSKLSWSFFIFEQWYRHYLES